MTDREMIGNVTLDLTDYSGEDFYTDGAIEDELLEIAKNNPPSAFVQIIAEKKSWPIFYHLSPFRTNIIDWLPIKKARPFRRALGIREYFWKCPPAR